MRKFMPLGLLGLCWMSLASAAPRDPAYPEQGKVRFGNLHWVGAQTLLPRVVNGQMLAPPTETCDLLGLSCTLNDANLSVNGQELPIVRLYAERLPMVALAPLVKLAGQSIGWNQAAKVATISGGTGSKGWRAVDQMVKVAASQTVYLGPLRASQTAPKTGQPAVQQIIFADSPLGEVTFFSKTPDALTVVGSLNPSTPDNPNKAQPCHADNPKVCELPVPRSALWVLVLATAK